MRARSPLVTRLAGSIGIFFAGALAAQHPPVAARAVAARVDSIAAAALAADSVPGMSVVVIRGSEVLIAKGYGVADREAAAPATAATVYQIGSISKQFTAAAVMRLVERGVIRLDDRVSRHLPEYSLRGDSVTIRQLLHQTSGIREEFTLPRYGELISDTTRPNGELMALIAREPLGFPPGSRWSYSNSNYALLASVIEQVTGQPYDRFLAAEFFGPLGLTSLHHCSPLPTARHHARGYVPDRGRIAPAPPENMAWIRGDGGLCGTADDLARWALALASGRALSDSSYRRMVTSERTSDGITPSYGFGLSLVPLDGAYPRVSHGGRMAGFTGVLAYYPQRDMAVAVLANRGGLWLEAVEQAVSRAVLGLRRPVVRRVAIAARDRRSYVGSYDIGIHGVTVLVTERAGELWLEWPSPGPTSKLAYQGSGVFAADLEPDAIRVTFAKADGSGRSTRLVLLMAGMHWYGRRVESR